MKKFMLLATLCVCCFGIAGCGSKEEMKADEFVNQTQAVDKGFKSFGDPGENGQGYMSPEGDVVAYFGQDGNLKSAYITNGPSLTLVNKDGEIFISNKLDGGDYYFNGKSCYVDNSIQPIDSDACKNQNIPKTSYSEYVEYFKSLMK